MTIKTLNVNASQLLPGDVIVGNEDESHHGARLVVTNTRPHPAYTDLVNVMVEDFGGWLATRSRTFHVEREVPAPKFKPGTLVDVNGDLVPLRRRSDGAWEWVYPHIAPQLSGILQSDADVAVQIEKRAAKIILGGEV